MDLTSINLRTLKWLIRGKMGKLRRTFTPFQAVNLAGDRVMTRTIWGQDLILDGHDLSLTPSLLSRGKWENRVTLLFVSHIRPGMRVADIGSNMGYFSVLAAKLTGKTGHVHAFEVNPLLYDLTFTNLEINGFLSRSTCHNVAVYSENTELDMGFCVKHRGSSSLYQQEETMSVYNDELEVQRVKAVTLDSELQGEKIDFLKMDVEGAEMEVLLGADEVFTRSANMKAIIEFSPGFFGDSEKPSAAWQRMVDWGYRIRQLGKTRLHSVSKQEALESGQVELFLERTHTSVSNYKQAA